MTRGGGYEPPRIFDTLQQSWSRKASPSVAYPLEEQRSWDTWLRRLEMNSLNSLWRDEGVGNGLVYVSFRLSIYWKTKSHNHPASIAVLLWGSFRVALQPNQIFDRLSLPLTKPSKNARSLLWQRLWKWTRSCNEEWSKNGKASPMVLNVMGWSRVRWAVVFISGLFTTCNCIHTTSANVHVTWFYLILLDFRSSNFQSTFGK